MALQSKEADKKKKLCVVKRADGCCAWSWERSDGEGPPICQVHEYDPQTANQRPGGDGAPYAKKEHQQSSVTREGLYPSKVKVDEPVRV